MGDDETKAELWRLVHTLPMLDGHTDIESAAKTIYSGHGGWFHHWHWRGTPAENARTIRAELERETDQMLAEADMLRLRAKAAGELAALMDRNPWIYGDAELEVGREA